MLFKDHSHSRLLAVLVFFLALATGVALAQSTAAFQGTVQDASGAVVAGATVTAHNQATGIERTTETDASGNYFLPALPAGSYRLEVKAKGLQTVAVKDLTLDVSSRVTQNFQLKVASSQEVVEVTGEAPVVDTASKSVGQVIDQRTVQEIPLNGRHFVDLGLLIPGSVTPPQSGFLTAPLRGQGSFAFNTAGNREDTVNFMINGINLNDMVQNQITFQPSINTVSEFKVDNSTYGAEFGRNSGAIVNIATRSGSNQWHGEGFEYLRNNALDARNYFNVKRTNAGVANPQSPFKRNQFGGNIGGPIWKNKTFFFFSYEGLRQRQGLNTTATVPTDVQRANVTDPASSKLLDIIPRANQGDHTFVGSASANVNIDQWTGDVSHNFSDRDRLHGYYAFQRDKRQEPTLQGNNIPDFGDIRQSHRQIFTLNESHVFNTRTVNEARFGFNRIHITFAPNSLLNPADFLINNGINDDIGLPQIAVSNGFNIGGPAGFPQGRGDTTIVFSDTLSYLRGKHTWKFGGEFRRFNNNNFNSDTGSFTFKSIDDFLAGKVNVFGITPGNRPSRIFVNSFGLFAEDSWKVLPALTLELGLRYDVNFAPTEAQNRFVIFDPATASLVQLDGGAYPVSNKNVQPRVGFAWDILHNGKLVLRSGYGLQTDQPVTNVVTGLASNPPFAAPVSISGNGTGTVTFGNAFTVAAGAGSLAPANVSRSFTNPYIQSWNLNIQSEITPTIGVMVGYFGSKGTHLRISRNINQFINGVRPFPTVSASSAIDPGIGLGNINTVDSVGNSNYNALWITANKRMSRNLQFNASYTFSKSLDYNSLSSQGTVIQNSYNPAGDYGLSDYDARNRFVINAIYDLPFKGNRAIDGWQVAGILQAQSGNPVTVVTGNSGLTGVGNTVRPNLVGVVTTGYDKVPNSNNIQYLPACSATSCPFQAVNAFGNLSRNSIIGPGFTNLDFSLLKNTKITERVTTQFRADFFDVFNHPNFGQPNRVLSTASGNTFGQITTTRFATGDSGSSRQLQLALKLIF